MPLGDTKQPIPPRPSSIQEAYYMGLPFGGLSLNSIKTLLGLP